MGNKIKSFDSKKYIEKFEFRRNILEALLYYSINKDQFIFSNY